MRRPQGARHDRRARRDPRRGRARRGGDRDPVGAGHAARQRRRRLPRARASRSAPCRPSSSCCAAASARPSSCARSRSRTCSAASRSCMELDRVGAYLAGEVVLVTGAGGSIGSELCRQIARVAPRLLVLLDHAEDNLFRSTASWTRTATSPASRRCSPTARSGERMREVHASSFKPDVVFHAAAYKHVPLMEANPRRGGPQQRDRHPDRRRDWPARPACERFVLVSTDKAVKPATVMGASKALAEWAIEARGAPPGTTLRSACASATCSARRGSVVPIFRRQIARGGPVTVTAPRDDPLLHDDPGGRAADHPRRRPRRAAARSSCSRWASRSRSSSSRAT